MPNTGTPSLSESIREKLSDQSYESQFLSEETSTAQPDVDHEEY